MLTTFILLAMAQTSSVDFAKVLDIDGDGVIHPMEAADAMQMFYDETGEGMPIADVDQIIEDYQIYCLEEAEFFIEDFDEDSDGIVQYSEIPDQYLAFAKYADINKDSKITLQELLQVDPNSVEVFAQVEIDGIFLDLDENNDDQIEIEAFVEDNIEFAELVLPFDTNKDKRISRDEMVAGFALLDASASFDISGDTALMRGTIDESTPFRVMELVYYHPEVKTIVMTDVRGSVDDDSSLRASRIVRSHGLNTHVPSDGEIESYLGEPENIRLRKSESQIACPADFDENGEVNVLDLLELIGAWGYTGPTPQDLNGDSTVTVLDLLILIGARGPCQ
ncbi:MAG: Ca2+-binding EF-hand superfamily protein [Phycisphaerales bacterium]|jgi:Ca2+-binding EF-hand superfamily protein